MKVDCHSNTRLFLRERRTIYIVAFGVGHATNERLVPGGRSTSHLSLIVCIFVLLDVVYYIISTYVLDRMRPNEN